MTLHRKIANFILIISALVLILNSVLPHHHHSEDICFVVDHCENGETDKHADHDGVEHEHHDAVPDFCQLNSLFLVSVNKNVTGKYKPDSSKQDFPIHNDKTIRIELISSSKGTEWKFIDTRYSLNPKCLIRALRAPPVC